MSDTRLDGLREAVDDDAEALFDLVGSVFSEYPGCVLDPDGVDRDLRAVRSWLARRGGRLWVVDDGDGGLAACVGYAPTDVAGLRAVELKRLYVARRRRRRGLGGALLERVGAVAATVGAPVVELWSDTRFEDAHRRYASAGYVRQDETRDLHDPSATTEYRYLRLAPPGAALAAVRWRGDDGRLDHCVLREGPDTAVLAGRVTVPDGCRSWDYHVTFDGRWRARSVDVRAVDGSDALRLAADGLGSWWQDGDRRSDLDGCLDVDLGCTPATNTAPVRRGVDAPVTAAWVRFPELTVTRAAQRYTRLAADRWRYASGSFEAELLVDRHGLVRRYGDGLWTACEASR